jgi:hypothetical protein
LLILPKLSLLLGGELLYDEVCDEVLPIDDEVCDEELPIENLGPLGE